MRPPIDASAAAKLLRGGPDHRRRRRRSLRSIVLTVRPEWRHRAGHDRSAPSDDWRRAHRLSACLCCSRWPGSVAVVLAGGAVVRSTVRTDMVEFLPAGQTEASAAGAARGCGRAAATGLILVGIEGATDAGAGADQHARWRNPCRTAPGLFSAGQQRRAQRWTLPDAARDALFDHGATALGPPPRTRRRSPTAALRADLERVAGGSCGPRRRRWRCSSAWQTRPAPSSALLRGAWGGGSRRCVTVASRAPGSRAERDLAPCCWPSTRGGRHGRHRRRKPGGPPRSPAAFAAANPGTARLLESPAPPCSRGTRRPGDPRRCANCIAVLSHGMLIAGAAAGGASARRLVIAAIAAPAGS